MPKASPGQFNFNGGEVSPLIEGRPDLDKYKTSVLRMENFIPTVQGGVLKRSGTRFVAAAKSPTKDVHLIPFRRAVDSSYILEFGDMYMRFFTNSAPLYNDPQSITGATQANPVVVTVTGHGLTDGLTVLIDNVVGMTELNGRRFDIANVTANTFELVGEDGTLYDAYVSGGDVQDHAEIVTPYLETEVFDIQVAQSADVMYLVHPNHPPYKLSRVAADEFTFEQVVFDWVPLLDENPLDDKKIVASAITGNITLTANTALFDPNHVNGYWELSELAESEHDKWEANKSVSNGSTRIFEGNVYEADGGGTTGTRPPVHLSGTQNDGTVDWIYLHSGSGYVQITAFTSSTVVDATVISDLPTSTTVGAGTFRWAEGAWSDFQGYPRAISFYETRLWFAGTSGAPQTLWASVTNSFEDFLTGEIDDDSLRYTINTDQVNTIQWLSPDKVMAIGTEGGEFIAQGNTLDEPITPTSVRIARQTTYGSQHIRPERSGASILFIQRAGRKIREYLYNFDIDRYIATDLTVLATHITKSGVRDSATQQEPNALIWYVTNDGGLFGLTYEREQEVVGFHRHVLAGADSKVLTASAIIHPDGDVDQLWVVAERQINGSPTRYVEYFEKEFTLEDAPEDAVFLDSSVSFTGSGLQTLTGLDHLEGEEVEFLVDGATVNPNQFVAQGSITLPSPGDKVVVGLAYNATLETLRIEAGAADGTSQGKTKRMNNLTIRLSQTGPGLFFGSKESRLDELFLRRTSDEMDTPVDLFTGDAGPQTMPSGYEPEGRIVIKHTAPLPCSVLALMPQLHTQDR